MLACPTTQSNQTHLWVESPAKTDQNVQAYPSLHRVHIHFLGFDVVQLNIAKLSQSTTKLTYWPMCPAKTQISLGIRSLWSESLLSAWRNLGLLVSHLAHNEDPDQTGWMPRLIWVFAGCTDNFVVFVVPLLKWKLIMLPGTPYGLPGPELAGECGPCRKLFGYVTLFGIVGSGTWWNGGRLGTLWPAGNSL